MATRNQIYVWDFTSPADVDPDAMRTLLNEIGKQWCFQKEKGNKTGYIHYQGKVSLKRKTRFPKNLAPENWSWSASANMGFSYVSKPDTRIEGPWKDTDFIPIVTTDMANFAPDNMYPFQKQIFDSKDQYEERKIFFVFDPVGCNGKSKITRYLCMNGFARSIPPLNDYKDIMQYVCSFPESPMYIIDMPRALKKEKMGQFFSGIETLKGGYAYDTRHKGKEMWFNPPVIWIFSNYMPALDLLSLDRWSFFKIDELKNFARL